MSDIESLSILFQSPLDSLSIFILQYLEYKSIFIGYGIFTGENIQLKLYHNLETGWFEI